MNARHLSIAALLLCCACSPNPWTQQHAPTYPQSPAFDFGINSHLDNYGRLKRAQELGASWIRMDMNWQQVEAIEGHFDFSAPDRCVNDACELGLQVYASVCHAPTWAIRGPGANGVPDPKAWRDFIRALVRHYKGQIGVYGIWNEPNLEEFWDGSASDYVQVLLLPAAAIIHQEDPGAKVAGPDLAHLYSARLGIDAFFKVFKAEGGDKAIDILSHHVYGADDFPQKISGFRIARLLYKPGLMQMLKANGLQNKEVWITEMGMDERAAGEKEQGRRLIQEIEYLRRQGWVKKVFVYELANDSEADDQWGLIRSDGSLRPAYLDLQNYGRQLARQSAP